MIKQPNGFKPIVFEGIKRYTLTKEVVADFFHKIYAFLIVAFPLMSLGQAFNMLAQVFLVALLSYAVTAPMPEEYYFPVRMRIAAYAITPPFVVSKLTSLFTDNPLQAPLTSVWFSLMLALLYFYVMIVLIRRIDDAPAKA